MNPSWRHGLKDAHKDKRDHTSGLWKVNVFFFLITSVHSLVVPWLPKILKLSGMSYSGIGLTMAIITTVTLVSVKIVLVFMTVTRNGAVRRFTLFLLLVSSLAIYVVAIAVLPTQDIYKRCSANGITFNNFEQEHDYTETTHSPLSIKTEVLVTLSNKNDTTILTELYSNFSKVSKPSSMIPTPVAIFSSNFTSPININSPLNVLKSTTSVKNFTEVLDIITPQITPETTVETDMTATSTIQQTTIKPLVIPHFGSGSVIKSTSLPSFIEENIHSYATSDLADTFLSTSTEYTQEERNSVEDIKPLSSEEDYSKDSRNTASYQKPNDLSQSEINEDEKNVLLKLENNMNAMTNMHLDRNVNYHYLNSKVSHNYPTRLSEQISNLIPKNSDDTAEFSSRQGSDILRYKKIPLEGINLNKFERFRRLRRSLGEDNTTSKSLTIKDLNKTNLDRNAFKVYFQQFKELESFFLNKDSSTKKPKAALSSKSYTWLWVSILLVNATLLGSGIEASVTRLWHCFSHGYHLFHNKPRLDTNSDDLLERTLTDTFELSARGEHYAWSRLLAACTLVAAALLLAAGCQIGLSPGWSLAGQAGLFAVGGVFTVAALLFILPVPYGSIKSPKISRPLSLYLDDEVLWEGLRRIACPSATAAHGLLSALPAVYVVLLLEYFAEQLQLGSALPLLGVSCSLLGEGFATCSRRRLAAALDSPCLVAAALGGLALQLFLTHELCQSAWVWVAAASWLLVGASDALMAMSVRQNALMLATIRDQEREAWVSWSCGRLGTAAGAVLWPAVSAAKWGQEGLHHLLLPAAATSGILAALVIVIALLTRSRRAARRRVYHTLDLHSCADDEESDEEEDWLVRGARKEGLAL